MASRINSSTALRLQSLFAGLLVLLSAALLALAPAQANPASGGYQLFEPVTLEHQHAIQLASLGNFDYFAKVASECCNAPNTGPSLPATQYDVWSPPAGYVRNADGTVTHSASGQVYTPVRDSQGNVRTNSNGDPIFNTSSSGTTAQTTLTDPSVSGPTITPPAPNGGRNTWTEHLDYDTLYSGATQGSRNSLRGNMVGDEGLGLGDATGWQAHHILPWEHRNHPMVQRLGLDLNNPQNGVPLPCNSGGAGCLSTHSGSHGNYNEAFGNFLDRVDNMNVPDATKRNLVSEGIERSRQTPLSGNPPLRNTDGGTVSAWNNVFNQVGQ